MSYLSYYLASWLVCIFPLSAFYVDVYLSDSNEQARLEITDVFEVESSVQAFCGQYNLDAISCSSINETVMKLYAPYTPIKPTVKSFDIFDTILARDVIQPNDIFSIVEVEYPYPNFRQFRQQAGDQANGTFDDIYKIFQDLTGENARVIEQLKRFEVECELNHTYIIEQNYRLVHDGDILITDMYLPYEMIAKLLKHAGYEKATNIYASDQGQM
eukprot:gene38963-52626_t